jgi:HSP20 family protein
MVDFSILDTPIRLSDALHRLFGASLVRPDFLGGAASLGIPVDLYATSDRYTLRAILPGVRPEDAEVTYHNGVVRLAAALPAGMEGEAVTPLVAEIPSGTVERAIRLPEPIDADKIASSLVNGVLTLTLPKAEAAKPKRIAAGGQTPVLVGAGAEQ